MFLLVLLKSIFLLIKKKKIFNEINKTVLDLRFYNPGHLVIVMRYCLIAYKLYLFCHNTILPKKVVIHFQM